MVYWLATGGGRLRLGLAHAVKYVLHHEFGHFVKGNKNYTLKKDWSNFLRWRQKEAIWPTYPHANILAFPGDDNLSNTHK